ncbi:MAG: nitrogenase component 1, partial [Ruminiclostridium sp.]
FPVKWYSTNLNEQDTILGSDEKLRNAVYRVHKEQNPKVIFIVGTPVVAINNDDVNSVILELEDELGIKIIFIYSDGFKTKTPVTGYDIALHGLLRYVVSRDPAQKEQFINVVTLSENPENLSAVTKILSDLGIRYNLLPQFSDIDSIRNASAAQATVVLNEDEGALFAEELEASFGVPYIRTAPPVGIKAVKAFVLALGQALHIEEQAAQYAEKEEEKLRRQLEALDLKGARIFFEGNLPVAAGFYELIQSVKGEFSAIAVPYVDLQNRKYLDSLPAEITVVVGAGQLFEKANVLTKNSSDYYISTNSDVVTASRTGAGSISLAKEKYFGYEGSANLLKLINEADRQISIRKKLQLENEHYKPAWLKRSSNWYVKQEVK